VNQETQAPNYNDDEIDLFELIETLWKEKLTIIGLTLLFAFGGVGYALLSTPSYEATASLLPPTQKDIAELTKADSLAFSESTSTSTSTSVYSLFARVLNSNQLRMAFLSQPEINAIFNVEGSTEQGVWKSVNEAVKVNVPTKGAVEKIDVIATHSDPVVAANLANSFVELALNKTREQLVSDFNEQLNQRIEAVEGQVASREATYVTNVEKEVLKLKDALVIANQINQKSPIDIQQLIEASSTTMMVDELRRLYRLGSDALEAEIAMLNERKKDKKLVPGLTGLQQQLALLKSTSVDPERVIPAQIDLAAMVPEYPVKPKKSLIVALAVVLGGMLGVVFVLIRQAVRNRKVKTA
jgi:chain length determinant protein (polysaccharide antigen chain regulator)